MALLLQRSWQGILQWMELPIALGYLWVLQGLDAAWEWILMEQAEILAVLVSEPASRYVNYLEAPRAALGDKHEMESWVER